MSSKKNCVDTVEQFVRHPSDSGFCGIELNRNKRMLYKARSGVRFDVSTVFIILDKDDVVDMNLLMVAAKNELKVMRTNR